MPSFATPGPISATLGLGVGNLRISASERADTVVDVRPSDPSDPSDVQAADKVRVEYTDGTLRITGPKVPAFDFSRRTRSVEVSIDLPAGSRVAAEVQVGDLNGTGSLGECSFTTSTGNALLERTGPLRVRTAAGHVAADTVGGDTEIRTGSGRVRLGGIDGAVVVKNSNGDTEIRSASGAVQVRAANGDISVDRADAGVVAKTSNGSIRVGEVARGSVELRTAMGEVEVGIAENTAAWLEVHTGFGQIRNLLEDADRAGASEETVEVRAHTSFGGITIRRS